MNKRERIIFAVLVGAILVLLFLIAREMKESRNRTEERSWIPQEQFNAYETEVPRAQEAQEAQEAKTNPVSRKIAREVLIGRTYEMETQNGERYQVQVGGLIPHLVQNDTRPMVHVRRVHEDEDENENETETTIEEELDIEEDENEFDTDARNRAEETPGEFFDGLQRDNHEDDAQNVHDPQVIKSLSVKYERLVELHKKQNAELLDSIAELGMDSDAIQEAKMESTMREISMYSNEHIDYLAREGKIETEHVETYHNRIEVVLDEIQKGKTITSISSAIDEDGSKIPIREDWILTLVWERIHSDENILNADQLRMALFDQLIDCTYIASRNDLGAEIIRVLFGLRQELLGRQVGQDGYIGTYCINGRVGRMISIFTLLDADEILSEPEKDEKELQNEAYTKAHKILEEELDTYEISLPELKGDRMRDLYVKPEETLSMRERLIVQSFVNHTKERISDTLKSDYENLIDENTLYTLIDNSIAGV